jgi:hypothetical protein
MPIEVAVGGDVPVDAECVVACGRDGEILLDVMASAGVELTLSFGAVEAVHLIRLLAAELTQTEPLRDYVLP